MSSQAQPDDAVALHSLISTGYRVASYEFNVGAMLVILRNGRGATKRLHAVTTQAQDIVRSHLPFGGSGAL